MLRAPPQHAARLRAPATAARLAPLRPGVLQQRPCQHHQRKQQPQHASCGPAPLRLLVHSQRGGSVAARATGSDWGSNGSNGSNGGNGSGGLPPLDPVAALKRELGMQSNQLPAQLREAVEAAIARLGYRVTVGQVAASAGVKLSDADRALKALAYDSLGNLEVSSEGEVVYSFGRDFTATIRRRSWLARLRPLAKRAANAASYLARVAFGSALIASAVVVWLAVIALTSSRDSDRRDSGYYGGPRGYVFFDPTDLLLVWDPYYSRHSRRRADSDEGMTFVEAVFSWVFGDGNPNANFEERRWRALGAHIQRLGGVLSAEEMAPFLDPPPLRRGRDGRAFPAGPEKYEDESFVLPALIRFNGEPFVDEAGRLLYRFPDLQVVAGALPSVRLQAAEAKVPLEREWEFSAASPGQQAGTIALGVFNVVGVITLSSLLADPVAKLALFRQGLGFVLGLLPYLQTYAAAFFALPLLRAVLDGRRNAAIDERNEARLEAVSLLSSNDPELAAKSAAARKLGTTRVIGRGDVIYTTETATDAQANAADADAWDARLRGGGGGSSGGRGAPQLPEGRRNRIDDVFGRREARQRQAEADARQVEVDWSGSSSSRRQRRRQDDDWERLDRW